MSVFPLQRRLPIVERDLRENLREGRRFRELKLLQRGDIERGDIFWQEKFCRGVETSIRRRGFRQEVSLSEKWN